MRWIIGIIILILAVIAAGFGYYYFQPGQEVIVPNADEAEDVVCGQGSCVSDTLQYGTQVGTVFEDVTLTDFEGNEKDLYDLMEGYDKTIIMLEADWCEDCQRQTEKLLKDTKAQQDVLFIPIYTTYSKEGDPKKQATYESSKKYAEKTYKDSNIVPYWDVNDELWNKYGGYGTPTNIVLDKNAKIKDITLETDYDTLLLPNTEEEPYDEKDL